MAVRINVTAIRDVDPAEVRPVMSRCIKMACAGDECGPPVGEHLDIKQHNGWTWFTTSVWGVSASELNRGLCELARPALQFTSSDGSRWYLTVHGGRLGQVHFLHEFGEHSHDPSPEEDDDRLADLKDESEEPEIDPRLMFLEDDRPEGADRPRVPFDLIADSRTEMGYPIPEELRREIGDAPYSAAVARFRRWHAEQILSALTDAGIPNDADAVRAVLLWENVTERERDGDLGNLPRLLAVLGLGSTWDDYVRQTEQSSATATSTDETEEEEELDEEEVDAADAEPEADLIGPVLALTDGLELFKVEGGPVELPIKRLADLAFFPDALACDVAAAAVLTLTTPTNFDFEEVKQSASEDDHFAKFIEHGFRIGFESADELEDDTLRDQLGPALIEITRCPPDGAVLDLAFAHADQTALIQRYRGEVVGLKWRIAHSYPKLSADVLREALKLARGAEKTAHLARDEQEAAAIVAAANQDPEMKSFGLKTRSKGLTVGCKDDGFGALAKVIFRLRHRNDWNVAAYEHFAAEKLRAEEERRRQAKRAATEAARRRAADHEEEIVLKGAHSIFWRADFTSFDQLEQDTRRQTDDAMSALGFRWIGDLVAKKQRDIIVRGYHAADGSAFAVLMGKRTMYLGYEFFSRFADGATLTTTVNSMVESRPDAGVFYKPCPGLKVPELHAKHLWGIERFWQHRQTRPVAMEGTLESLAREIDAAFGRAEAI